jgi:hypothetical protein
MVVDLWLNGILLQLLDRWSKRRHLHQRCWRQLQNCVVQQQGFVSSILRMFNVAWLTTNSRQLRRYACIYIDRRNDLLTATQRRQGLGDWYLQIDHLHWYLPAKWQLLPGRLRLDCKSTDRILLLINTDKSSTEKPPDRVLHRRELRHLQPQHRRHQEGNGHL